MKGFSHWLDICQIRGIENTAAPGSNNGSREAVTESDNMYRTNSVQTPETQRQMDLNNTG